jgi:hypothetical protein
LKASIASQILTTTSGFRDYVEVKVTRNPHSFRGEEFVFEDIRKHKRSTVKEQCEQLQYNGEWVWAFHGRTLLSFTNPCLYFFAMI